MAVARAASVLGSFPFRAALVALCVLLLPLLPSPQGGGEDGGGGHAFLAKVWELLHLLLVGIAVSYGLFGRRNDDGGGGGRMGAGGGGGGGEKDVGGAAPAMGKTTDARYVSRMLQGDLVFDDDDGDGARSWSALHHAEEPVVMVADGGGGRSSHVAQQQAPPLSLPVRALRPQQDPVSGDGEPRPPRRSGGGAHDDTVLPSPIPWRSRTGRLGGDAPTPSNTSSPAPSPKRLSPAPSMSNEAPAEEHEVPRRRSTYRSSQPPAPPPPPPPFLVHGYHPVAERRTTAAAAAKSFKEELQHHSTRGRGDRDRYSQSSHSFSNSNSSSANPRSSFDGSSAPSSPSVGRSVRTIRPRQGIQTQTQIQELPNDDDGGGGDAPDNSRGSEEEPYGYRAYQSIPRFQYEKGSSSDPILGKVTVSSDETESSDDDDDEAFSTRATNSPSTAAAVDENEVDKKAEEFIARFREQIRLQRIESIKKSAGPRAIKHGK